MNSDEVQLIKKTWEGPVATPTESGAAILTLFFNRYPSNLEKFPFRDVPLEELAVCIFKLNDLNSNLLTLSSFRLQNNARFRAHAGRIIRVFDESIQVLGQEGGLEKIEEIWTKIAVNHIPRKISKESYYVNAQLHTLFLHILYLILCSFYSNSRRLFWK